MKCRLGGRGRQCPAVGARIMAISIVLPKGVRLHNGLFRASAVETPVTFHRVEKKSNWTVRWFIQANQRPTILSPMLINKAKNKKKYFQILLNNSSMFITGFSQSTGIDFERNYC